MVCRSRRAYTQSCDVTGAYDFISIIKMSCVCEDTDLSTSIIREVTFLNIALATPGFRYTTYKIPLSLEDIMEKFNPKKKKTG